MNTLDLLSKLRDLGIKISTDGDKLQCNAPKGTLTPQLRSELAERKEEIIDLLKNNNLLANTIFSGIESVSRDQILPLSFAQQRLWFLDRLESNSSFYNIPEAIRLKGKLNVDILQQSLDEIVAHHEILHTNYIEVNGNPIQSISKSRSVILKIIDLQQYENTEQEIQVQQILKEESQYPFNLTSDLMLRACLIQLSPSEQILLLVKHHIASDGWSMGIMWEQLTQLYLAFLEGKPNPLPPLSIQYADYAVWQRKWLSGELLEKQLNYWKTQLNNANPLLELPTDFARPSMQTYCGATQSHTLSPSLSREINQLCQQEGATLYMGLLAAFQILLYRYSQQEDILVGTVIAGRNRKEIEGLIGFFVNTLVLRANLSENPSFKELLSQVRATTIEAYDHQDLPFEKLVEALNPERSSSYSPIFQVMFVLQNTHNQRKRLLGLAAQSVEIEIETSKFDLELSVEEKDSEIIASWTYNTSLFDHTTIERMRDHFEILIESIIENPKQSISQLSILTEREKYQLLVEWNDTNTDYPQDKCIHQLFEEQVERTPDAIALIFENEQLSYQELNCRANQLAHYLRGLGIGADSLVGIYIERSLETVIGILGILKAGGAYVPLDPSYPPERLAFMVADTQVSVLITQQRLLEQIPPNNAQVVCLDTDWQAIALQSQENPTCNVTPDNLAYVIYTSGSTGVPKGVSVVHRGVVRLVKSANYADFSPEQIFLQLAHLAFDASTFEVWGALLNGARLVLFPSDKPSLAELGQVIERYQVTIIWLTAGLFHLMVDEQLESLRPLKQLLAGGDVLSVNHVQRFREALPNCQLINGYGPTESTTFTCCYPIKEAKTLGNSVPIGRPINNTQVYILNPQLQPTPIGAIGEIYIGGDGLASGYFNRPELTTERFVPNPFSNQSGAKLYKTGDLARYFADGNIEFLGRIDNQVKIRGFRIELGEVEAVLSQYPTIQKSVVILREDKPADKRIVAYFVPISGQEVAVTELRNFFKQKLPDYMVPNAFVSMESLPLSPNGKIARKELPAPDGTNLNQQNYVPPRNPTEQQIADVWAQVLNLEKVGIHDNFFELGGHSLLATQIIARLRKSFAVELSLRTFFEVPTIGDLGERVTTLVWAKQSVEAAQSSLSDLYEEGEL